MLFKHFATRLKILCVESVRWQAMKNVCRSRSSVAAVKGRAELQAAPQNFSLFTLGTDKCDIGEINS